MINKFKPISISLSPNVQKDDVSLALKLLFQPWKWKQGKAVCNLEEEFRSYFGVKYAVSFNSGRSSFYAILKALNLQENSDVSLQAFTCNAVPNPILWAGLNPVYIDCNKRDFNIDIDSIKQSIYSHIRTNMRIVLVVQHTFGIPARMDEIMKIAKENDILVIEDCAHSLGAKFNGQKLGTFDKASFFSFSRDKVISSVYGGMAVTNDDEIGKKLMELQNQFRMPSNFWVLQQIWHPIILQYLILPIYAFLDLGKVFLVLSQWTHLLSKAVSWKEKRGQKPDYFPRALPNAMAAMAVHQFRKINKFYRHRKKLSEFYYENLNNTSFEMPDMSPEQSFLRFVIKHKKAHEIIFDAWHNENILLGDWYTTAIAPDDTRVEEMKYIAGSCSNAEELAKEILNLPTHINISMNDAERVVKFLKKYA